ncbi:MAG: hypothetical protein AABY22_26925 [Nanoarchaeota archaeon]
MKDTLTNEFNLIEGCTLTVANEVFNEAGTVFEKGQKVEVEAVIRTAGRWARFHNGWIPAKIDGVRIKGTAGMWFLKTFEETNNFKFI